jgi:hypothetical protein
VSQRTWQDSGSEYMLSWGGQPWTLELDGDRPGMRTADRPADCALALDGVAAVGRIDHDAFSGKSLVGVERVAHRVEATFAPPRWGGLEVRASWSPSFRHDGIDLEIQILASSVGELSGLEVLVGSRITGLGAPAPEPQPFWVLPRDSRSAGFSYDGREPDADLGRLTTLPLPGAIEPAFWQVAALGPALDSGGRYLEMAHPHDVARRMIWGQDPREPAFGQALQVRYGLFGHELEKGVVVRARLRGLWISRGDVAAVPPVALREFLATPPPLGR